MSSLNQENKQICFATLALGKRYRILAKQLAKDFENYSPESTLLVLTENPKDFEDHQNVIVFKHKKKTWCDNDKSFLIEKGLSLYDCCIIIDADMRIVAPVTLDIAQLPEGIISYSSCNLWKHHFIRKNRASNFDPKLLALLKKIAQKLEIELENEKVKWVHEFLFVVNKGEQNKDKLESMVILAKKLSKYLEINGTQTGFGSALGIAAAKWDIPIIHHSEQNYLGGITFFKDRVEEERIKARKVLSPKEQELYDAQRAIEFPKYSVPKKIMVKLQRQAEDIFRTTLLKLEALRDFDFYYH